jgi:hypothetical protein
MNNTVTPQSSYDTAELGTVIRQNHEAGEIDQV